MSHENLDIHIAVSMMSKRIPSGIPLIERLKFAMRYVREHTQDLFWMNNRPSDDIKFRTALAAVMVDGSDEDQGVIERSLLPVHMLGAALNGIPVDFSKMPLDTDLLPLMRLWQESEEANDPHERG